LVRERAEGEDDEERERAREGEDGARTTRRNRLAKRLASRGHGLLCTRDGSLT
jgi:hypothetical protein